MTVKVIYKVKFQIYPIFELVRIITVLLLLPGTDNFNGMKATSDVSCAIKDKAE